MDNSDVNSVKKSAKLDTPAEESKNGAKMTETNKRKTTLAETEKPVPKSMRILHHNFGNDEDHVKEG